MISHNLHCLPIHVACQRHFCQLRASKFRQVRHISTTTTTTHVSCVNSPDEPNHLSNSLSDADDAHALGAILLGLEKCGHLAGINQGRLIANWPSNRRLVSMNDVPRKDVGLVVNCLPWFSCNQQHLLFYGHRWRWCRRQGRRRRRVRRADLQQSFPFRRMQIKPMKVTGAHYCSSLWPASASVGQSRTCWRLSAPAVATTNRRQ